MFTVPMRNGGISCRLKLYIDIMTQLGLLFGFGPATGYSGLLKGIRHQRMAWSYDAPRPSLQYIAQRVGFWKEVDER